MSFVENPDILAGIAATPRAASRQLYCVGFAAESQDLLANAQAKRARKGVPLLVANIGPATFGRDDNALLLVDDEGVTELPHASKRVLAQQRAQVVRQRVVNRGLDRAVKAQHAALALFLQTVADVVAQHLRVPAGKNPLFAKVL